MQIPQQVWRPNDETVYDADNLHRRLKKIIGQVQAIDRMVDEDVPCEDILAQINAAKSALHGCGKVVLEGHIKHCVRDGIEHGDADTLCANVRNVFEQVLEGEQRDCIEKIKHTLLLHGAKAAAMTGSGSVVFGLFSDETSCRAACDALQSGSIQTFCTEFV